MIATVFVVLASTVESLTSATYTGRGPVAEHKSLSPVMKRTSGAGSGDIILGGASKKNRFKSMFLLKNMKETHSSRAHKTLFSLTSSFF